MITNLYVDGGVIARNPSIFGGTWAWIATDENDEMCGFSSNVITPDDAGMLVVTNNLTELLAIIYGLESLPHSFGGTVYSDSAVSLGRIFHGWQWKNVPPWVHKRYQAVRSQLLFWPTIRPVLLNGHPTRVQLASGLGARGQPVSKWNVLCDKLCSEAGKNYMLSQNVSPLRPETV